MEEWQEKHIKKNLDQLITLTQFNCIVKAKLVAKNILCQADVNKLDAVERQDGELEACRLYYDTLRTRKGAYSVLYKALTECNQSGAARLLVRDPTETFSKPSSYLGISTALDGYPDAQIEVNGKVFKLQEFFLTANKKILETIFRETISEVEFNDSFVIKEKTFVLAKNTIPPKPPFYVSRCLSNRVKLDKSIFQEKCEDVFVFKNSIARYQITHIAKPHFTANSASQLTKITSRFIYLEENEDWIELKQLAIAPIHLIRYDDSQEIFILEDTSAVSDTLRKILSENSRISVSEDEFVQQQLSDDSKASSVCICDTPGMGKTFLLANIASLMTDACAGRIIAFIPLTIFTTEFSPSCPHTERDIEGSLLNVLRYISNSDQSANLLLKLLNAKQVRLEVFFDGFDEIPENKLNWMEQVFMSLITEPSEVQIYITSRTHMRQELEERLRVLAYDIMPFNQQNQVDFMVKFWSQKMPNIEKKSIKIYATNCLEAVNKSLLTTDKEITGIPLLCLLIAELYANKVETHWSRKTFVVVPMTISKMFEKFIELRINLDGNNLIGFEEAKLVHIFHALKLILPEKRFHEDKQFNCVIHLLQSVDVLRMGLVQQQSQSTMEFIHRTFAEYLVAEYFTKCLLQSQLCDVASIFKSFIPPAIQTVKCSLKHNKTSKYTPNYILKNYVITYFMDSMLDQDNISENVKVLLATFFTMLPRPECTATLCAFCQGNLYNIFSIFKEALMKLDSLLIQKCLPYRHSYQLLLTCMTGPTGPMFHSCIQLFTEVLGLDVTLIAMSDEPNIFLKTAVQCANYEAVEYFEDRVPIRGQDVLKECVSQSYGEPNICGRENVLQLLLNKDPSLIDENPYILFCSDIHLQLIKTLIKSGAKLTGVNRVGDNYNCAQKAGHYMSPMDIHQLVEFLLNECKAEHIFQKNGECPNSLPDIFRETTLLPETVKLLLNIPGINIEKNGENLLFHAAEGHKLDNLQTLVKFGFDCNARGANNRNLLHAALSWRNVKMVKYLMSLKLDPSSCDNENDTPLHKAVRAHGPGSVVPILVENGANVEAKNIRGHTALHLYAHCGKLKAWKKEVELLIEKGLKVNDIDNEGNTALHLCDKRKDIECLIELGADMHVKIKWVKHQLI